MVRICARFAIHDTSLLSYAELAARYGVCIEEELGGGGVVRRGRGRDPVGSGSGGGGDGSGGGGEGDGGGGEGDGEDFLHSRDSQAVLMVYAFPGPPVRVPGNFVEHVIPYRAVVRRSGCGKWTCSCPSAIAFGW